MSKRRTVCIALSPGHRRVVGNIISGLTAEKAHLLLLLSSLPSFHSSWFAEGQGSVLSCPVYIPVTCGESRQSGFESQEGSKFHFDLYLL